MDNEGNASTVSSLTQVGLEQKVKLRERSDASLEASIRSKQPACNTMMYVSINSACVALVLAGAVSAAVLSQDTDSKITKKIPALLSHMFDLQQHVQSIFIRTGESASRLALLDGIRVMAFIMVAEAHWRHVFQLPDLLPGNSGKRGVIIFFVLSGFLIPRVLVKSIQKANASSVLEQFPAFLGSRFLRVWPSINVFVPWSLACFGWAFTDKIEQGFVFSFWTYMGQVMWAPFLCINNYVPGRSTDPFGHLYTVSTEMQMYLCTPLMVAAYYQSHHPHTGYVVALFVLLGCLVASQVLGVSQWVAAAIPLLGVHPGPGYLWDCLPCYIVGMLSAYSYMDSDDRKGCWWVLDPLRQMQCRAAAVVIVSLVQASMLFLVTYLLNPLDFFQSTATAACAAVLIRLVLDPDLGGLFFYVFSSWPFYPLAMLSYTGYLCSYLGPLITKSLFMQMFAVDDSGVLISLGYFLASLCIDLGLAFLLSVLIDRPFMSIRECPKI